MYVLLFIHDIMHHLGMLDFLLEAMHFICHEHLMHLFEVIEIHDPLV